MEDLHCYQKLELSCVRYLNTKSTGLNPGQIQLYRSMQGRCLPMTTTYKAIPSSKSPTREKKCL